ncbi:MAG TPA: hypothetical protein PLQ00_12035, partial [Thermoguttaceae bacterium]|nr:hypothetical protein [Thermoguttaceae bacterium]
MDFHLQEEEDTPLLPKLHFLGSEPAIAMATQLEQAVPKAANAKIRAVYGNLVVVEAEGRVVQNSVAYCIRSDGVRLLSEVIRVRGQAADLQVFEETRG